MTKLDSIIQNKEAVTEKDLLELREELINKKDNLDTYERTALECLKEPPIRVEEFKLLLEMGF